MQPKTDSASGREKSPKALKTIKEAADLLDVPQHVLRFWETKFPQINPLKRGGGRRYYRPDDIETLVRIKHLLYKQGYTINGARKAFDKLEEVKETFSDVARGEPHDQANDNAEIMEQAREEEARVAIQESTDDIRQLAKDLREMSAELRKRRPL